MAAIEGAIVAVKQVDYPSSAQTLEIIGPLFLLAIHPVAISLVRSSDLYYCMRHLSQAVQSFE